MDTFLRILACIILWPIVRGIVYLLSLPVESIVQVVKAKYQQRGKPPG